MSAMMFAKDSMHSPKMRCVATLVMMRRTRMIVGHDADPLEPGDIHDDKDCVLFVPDPLDGLPAYSHHDRFAPWWVLSVMIMVGICHVKKSHHCTMCTLGSTMAL